jgi:hypothetical protein
VTVVKKSDSAPTALNHRLNSVCVQVSGSDSCVSLGDILSVPVDPTTSRVRFSWESISVPDTPEAGDTNDASESFGRAVSANGSVVVADTYRAPGCALVALRPIW